MNRQLIEQYAGGSQKLVQAYWGLTHDELFWQPPDGSWTLHQIAIHMMDSDLIASDRMKRVACMDMPLLVAYDETGFSKLPGGDSIPAFQAIELFVKNRQMTATILRALPDSAFERCGIHTESGKVSLAYLVESYVRHLDHHLVFIEKKRALMGC